jgi:hypothetical protein
MGKAPRRRTTLLLWKKQLITLTQESKNADRNSDRATESEAIAQQVRGCNRDQKALEHEWEDDQQRRIMAQSGNEPEHCSARASDSQEKKFRGAA